MATYRRGSARPNTHSLISLLPVVDADAVPLSAPLLAPLVVSPEEAAQKFAKTFYHALICARRTVSVAFDIAFNTVNAGGTAPQGGPFLLLPQGERGATRT